MNIKLSEIKREILKNYSMIGTLSDYSKKRNWNIKGLSNTQDRRTLVTPLKMTIDIDNDIYEFVNQLEIDLNNTTLWDNTIYQTPENRKGLDFYIYTTIPTITKEVNIILSANSTFPNGYTTENTRKIGGFHCLCESVGTITNHTLSDFIAGDILPLSIWDLLHRPIANPEGMVFNPNINRWIDIYLAGMVSNQLVSKYNIDHVTGNTTEKFHWYKFSQWFGNVGKRMLNQHEFQNSSLGSNQGTNITGGVNPITTGGYVDTASRRMISNIGCESMCGVLWQWGDQKGTGTGASWNNAYDGNDSLDVRGQHYLSPNVPLFGGYWNRGAVCGSRSSYWYHSPLDLSAYNGSRGSCEPVSRLVE